MSYLFGGCTTSGDEGRTTNGAHEVLELTAGKPLVLSGPFWHVFV